MELRIKRTDGAPVPEYAKPGDAGLDLTTRKRVTLAPGETATVPTGIAAAIPEGCVGLCFPRSGLASKLGINLANCVGVIDSGYRGEIMAPLHNISHDVVTIDVGERVFQLVIMPYISAQIVEVDELDETERGSDGFGSTGV